MLTTAMVTHPGMCPPGAVRVSLPKLILPSPKVILPLCLCLHLPLGCSWLFLVVPGIQEGIWKDSERNLERNRKESGMILEGIRNESGNSGRNLEGFRRILEGLQMESGRVLGIWKDPGGFQDFS